MKYYASFRRADGTDYRVKLDGRWSTHRMSQEALKIAGRREHFEKFLTVTIERESAPGHAFARLLPQAIKYPVRSI